MPEVLPCGVFPVETSLRAPVQQDGGGAEGGPLFGMRMVPERVDDNSVRLSWPEISLADKDMIVTAWDDGAAMFTPFSYQMPGDAVSKEWVFAAPLRVVWQGPKSCGVEATFIEVK